MRFYLYFMDNNHDLDVELMFLRDTQFDCVHLNFIGGHGQRRSSMSIRFYPCAWAARALKPNYS